MKTIAENIFDVQMRIEAAAKLAHRDKNQISLIAVSKTKSLSMIREAFDAGQRIFGENYVQEAVEKANEFAEPEWHLIGSLQTNKVKALAGHFQLIHSVDRIKLASEIERASSQAERLQDILIQVNIGDESTKQGATFETVPALIDHVQACPHLRLRGLMSLPPAAVDEVVGRGYFSTLREQMEKMAPVIGCRNGQRIYDFVDGNKRRF